MTSLSFFFIFIPILSLILLLVNFVFSPHNPYKEKISAFECGFHSFLSQNRSQFSISFFIFGLLFLLFDLEILLVYPYIVSSYNNSIYGLYTALLFLLVLTIGFVFELGKNALKIDSRQIFNLLFIKGDRFTFDKSKLSILYLTNINLNNFDLEILNTILLNTALQILFLCGLLFIIYLYDTLQLNGYLKILIILFLFLPLGLILFFEDIYYILFNLLDNYHIHFSGQSSSNNNSGGSSFPTSGDLGGPDDENTLVKLLSEKINRLKPEVSETKSELNGVFEDSLRNGDIKKLKEIEGNTEIVEEIIKELDDQSDIFCLAGCLKDQTPELRATFLKEAIKCKEEASIIKELWFKDHDSYEEETFLKVKELMKEIEDRRDSINEAQYKINKINNK